MAHTSLPSEHLRKIRDDLDALLGKVVTTERPAPQPSVPFPGQWSDQHLAASAREYLKVRALRKHISPNLFADPAWDMLVDAFVSDAQGRRNSVSALCIASGAPPTTALRHIQALQREGLLERQADPNDGRRVHVALSDSGRAAIRSWLLAFVGMAERSQ